MTNSQIEDVIQMGVYGEKEVCLGLSRPLDGLAGPIKLLRVRIALILAYFGVAVRCIARSSQLLIFSGFRKGHEVSQSIM